MITAANVTDFLNCSTAEVLAYGPDGVVYLDGYEINGPLDAYGYVPTEYGTEVQILIVREDVRGWFPDAFDAEANKLNVSDSIAAEMAGIVNDDSGLIVAAAIRRARAIGEQAEIIADGATAAAQLRAAAIAEVVRLHAGNQSAAARALGIDQSRVSRLTAKAADLTGAMSRLQDVVDQATAAMAELRATFGMGEDPQAA